MLGYALVDVRTVTWGGEMGNTSFMFTACQEPCFRLVSYSSGEEGFFGSCVVMPSDDCDSPKI